MARPSRKVLATMSHEAALIYSEALVRHAVFAFWRRTVDLPHSLFEVSEALQSVDSL